MSYTINFDGDAIATNTGVPGVSGTRLASYQFEPGTYPKKNIFEPMPLGDGEYMKPNGKGAAVHKVILDIFVPVASVDDVREHFDELNDSDAVASLSIPEYGSYTNCAIENISGPGALRKVADQTDGTEGYIMHYEIVFRQIV